VPELIFSPVGSLVGAFDGRGGDGGFHAPRHQRYSSLAKSPLVLGASVGWAEAAAMRAGGTKRLKCMVAVGLMLVDGFLEVTSVLVSGKGRTAMAGSSTLFTRYLQGDGKPQPAKFASHNTPRGSITNTRSMQ
jgi:hypothetical protein